MLDTREKLSPISVSLHWLVGLTMIGMVAMGMWIADVLPKGEFKSQMVGLHKSIGVIVLVFAVWRLMRRLWLGLPQALGTVAAWQHWLASSVHYRSAGSS
jgi:cytochrome b561